MEVKKVTSKELYNCVMEEISPINCERLRNIYRTKGEKRLKDISRSTVKAFAPCEASKQLIGRAATLLYLELKNIVS